MDILKYYTEEEYDFINSYLNIKYKFNNKSIDYKLKKNKIKFLIDNNYIDENINLLNNKDFDNFINKYDNIIPILKNNLIILINYLKIDKNEILFFKQTSVNIENDIDKIIFNINNIITEIIKVFKIYDPYTLLFDLYDEIIKIINDKELNIIFDKLYENELLILFFTKINEKECYKILLNKLCDFIIKNQDKIDNRNILLHFNSLVNNKLIKILVNKDFLYPVENKKEFNIMNDINILNIFENKFMNDFYNILLNYFDEDYIDNIYDILYDNKICIKNDIYICILNNKLLYILKNNNIKEYQKIYDILVKYYNLERYIVNDTEIKKNKKISYNKFTGIKKLFKNRIKVKFNNKKIKQIYKNKNISNNNLNINGISNNKLKDIIIENNFITDINYYNNINYTNYGDKNIIYQNEYYKPEEENKDIKQNENISIKLTNVIQKHNNVNDNIDSNNKISFKQRINNTCKSIYHFLISIDENIRDDKYFDYIQNYLNDIQTNKDFILIYTLFIILCFEIKNGIKIKNIFSDKYNYNSFGKYVKCKKDKKFGRIIYNNNDKYIIFLIDDNKMITLEKNQFDFTNLNISNKKIKIIKGKYKGRTGKIVSSCDKFVYFTLSDYGNTTGRYIPTLFITKEPMNHVKIIDDSEYNNDLISKYQVEDLGIYNRLHIILNMFLTKTNLKNFDECFNKVVSIFNEKIIYENSLFNKLGKFNKLYKISKNNKDTINIKKYKDIMTELLIKIKKIGGKNNILNIKNIDLFNHIHKECYEIKNNNIQILPKYITLNKKSIKKKHILKYNPNLDNIKFTKKTLY